ncbi:MAG: hypothetical protein F4190_02160 [Acidimicrobiales bacterium]|nr:hypothetical protein [Acidimicrobiales bacterium]MYI28058.1 hypothetical protein [Acidimicrobiales bacterium]
MSIPTDDNTQAYETLPFKVHPRIFSALGENLVTSEFVAVIELVKNSFDAFASTVDISFSTPGTADGTIVIRDDGLGMSRETIEDVWCLVATPYKSENAKVARHGSHRRVVGEKGLGRLSAARLGERLTILTQEANGPCWDLAVDWSTVSAGDDFSNCRIDIREYPGESPFSESGTLLRVGRLREEWTEDRISQLEDNLARLISPFADLGDFNITVTSSSDEGERREAIEAPEFLNHPKYRLEGTADRFGNLSCRYEFRPFSEDVEPCDRSISSSWQEIRESEFAKTDPDYNTMEATCGPFEFEFRAWDTASDDTDEISSAFDYKKSLIRQAIAAHGGVSVYRDGLLVLPKSESARDWLGLDLRRVSFLGPRLSTRQLVGYVSIGADSNRDLIDTSDRERLIANRQAREFEAIIHAAIKLLENQRNSDRQSQQTYDPLSDLFSDISADQMVASVETLAEEGVSISSVLPVVRQFQSQLDDTRERIERRFMFYSRLATIGTIAQRLIHEIRNRTSAVGRLLRYLRDSGTVSSGTEGDSKLATAEGAVSSLDRLANVFAPLANRNFRRGRRDSSIEDRIAASCALLEQALTSSSIEYEIPDGETRVKIDPGELDAVLVNLISNAIYWMGRVGRTERRLSFAVERSETSGRALVWVHDTGTGVDIADSDVIFLPGVTRKPDGIGMGLTVAADIVSGHDGKLAIQQPGEFGGGTFVFDLPLAE